MTTFAYASYIDLMLNMMIKICIIAVSYKVIQFLNVYINKNLNK